MRLTEVLRHHPESLDLPSQSCGASAALQCLLHPGKVLGEVAEDRRHVAPGDLIAHVQG